MRFALLASGSKGNAALIESGPDLILLDCGISRTKIRAGMQQLGADIAELTCIVITHDHSDHVSSLAKITGVTNLHPYMTHGTARQLGLSAGDYHPLCADQPVTLSPATALHPYTVPHDAREAVQFCFEAHGAKLAFATDIGRPNPYLHDALAGCNALVLECNYDPNMLENNSDYPRWLKERIRGGRGHLSNDQAAELLGSICHDNLRTVIAAHLSENNNTPDIARKTLLAKLHSRQHSLQLEIARQRATSPWFEVA